LEEPEVSLGPVVDQPRPGCLEDGDRVGSRLEAALGFVELALARDGDPRVAVPFRAGWLPGARGLPSVWMVVGCLRDGRSAT
jgi:hypothetical protein